MRFQKVQASKTFKDSVTSSPVLKGPPDLRQQSPGLGRVRKGAIARAADVLTSVFPNDTIADRLTQPESLDAAAIQSTDIKPKRLNSLIESVPNGANKRQAKIDKRTMLKASRSFGYGKVRSGETRKWQFHGLQSQLYHHQLLAADFMVRLARLNFGQAELTVY